VVQRQQRRGKSLHFDHISLRDTDNLCRCADTWQVCFGCCWQASARKCRCFFAFCFGRLLVECDPVLVSNLLFCRSCMLYCLLRVSLFGHLDCHFLSFAKSMSLFAFYARYVHQIANSIQTLCAKPHLPTTFQGLLATESCHRVPRLVQTAATLSPSIVQHSHAGRPMLLAQDILPHLLAQAMSAQWSR
jgi:hypothetical protein